MPRQRKLYTVQDATGTTEELYAWITKGVENPPSRVAFESRLKRGERNPAELRRPPGNFSSASTQARTNGLKAYHERRHAMTVVSRPPTASLPQSLRSEQKPPRHRYFRPGSLDPWPLLKEALEATPCEK